MPLNRNYTGATPERLMKPRIPAEAYMAAFGEEFSKIVPNAEDVARGLANLSIAGARRLEDSSRVDAVGLSLFYGEYSDQYPIFAKLRSRVLSRGDGSRRQIMSPIGFKNPILASSAYDEFRASRVSQVSVRRQMVDDFQSATKEVAKKRATQKSTSRSSGGTSPSRPLKSPSIGSSSGGKPPGRGGPPRVSGPSPSGSPFGGDGPIRLPGMTNEEITDFFAKYTQIQENILDRIRDAAGFQPISNAKIRQAIQAGVSLEETKVLRAMLDSTLNLRDFIQMLPYKDRENAIGAFRNLFQFEQMLGDKEDLLTLIFQGRQDVPRELSERVLSENSRLVEIGEPSRTGRVFRFRAEAGNIVPPGKKNPLSVILNNLNINMNEAQANKIIDMVANGTSIDDLPEDEIRKAFKFGSNVMKADYVRGLDKIVTEGIALNNGVANIMVFDTETLGLAIGKGNIREISMSTLMYRGQAGVDEIVDPFSAFFKVSAAQTGMIRNPKMDETRRLYQVFDDIAEEAYRADSTSTLLVKNPGSGDDFTDAIKIFLRKMRDADYIMGHNVQFDIGQVVTGTKLTSQYLNGFDQELVDLVDEVSEKVNRPGKVIDTLHMAKQKLPGLKSAAELAFAGEKTTHSIENLVLQTNLIDLMVEEAGGGQAARDQVLKMISEGLHAGRTDIRLTSELFRFMERDQLIERSLGVGATANREFYSAIRTAVRRSYAPIPIANIADVRDIDPRMFRKLMEEGEDRVRFQRMDLETGTVTPLRKVATGQDIYSIGDFTGTSEDLQRLLSEPNAPFYMAAEITPIEQEVYLTRNLTRSNYAGQVTDDMFFNLGVFRRSMNIEKSGSGPLNRIGTFFKRQINVGDYSEVQRAMRQSGMPFGGLSMPEAQVTNAMARATAPNASVLSSVFGESYRPVVDLADDIGISHFKLWDEAMVTQQSGRVQLPIEILRAAGVLGDESEVMLSLSGFDYADKQTSSLMNGLTLSLDMTDENLEQIRNFIQSTEYDDIIEGTDKTLYDFFAKKGEKPTKESLLEGLASTGKKYGIGVGGLDDEMALRVNQVLRENALFEEFLRDSNKIPFRVRLLDTFTEGGQRVARVGPFVLDRFMDETQRADYAEASNQARRMLDDMVEHVSRPGGKNVLAAAKFADITGRSDIAQRVMTSYAAAKKSAPFALGITALAIGGYFFAKKQRESEFYDETMEEQPTETSGDYMRYRKQMGMQPAPARRLMDPLLTSYVVGDLDNNKIGHTMMGSQKYSHLYQ